MAAIPHKLQLGPDIDVHTLRNSCRSVATPVVAAWPALAAAFRFLQVAGPNADIRSGEKSPNATTTALEDEGPKLFVGGGAPERQMHTWRMENLPERGMRSSSRRGSAAAWL